MTNTSRNKDTQLGMSHGKAANRLRQIILFDLVQRVGENLCFRCGDFITCAHDLSIDHKEPWLHHNVKRFWDLNNITFSHQTCNSGNARHPTKYFDGVGRHPSKKRADRRRVYSKPKRKAQYLRTGK